MEGMDFETRTEILGNVEGEEVEQTADFDILALFRLQANIFRRMENPTRT
jgi:hypothetical protein